MTSKGYYRGNISALVRDAMTVFNGLPPEKQAEIREEQRLSWVRGEAGIGSDADEAAAREAFLASTYVNTMPNTSTDSVAQTMTQAETARLSGFTGNQCSNCQSMRMQIAGHCEVCSDCGTTTGCS